MTVSELEAHFVDPSDTGHHCGFDIDVLDLIADWKLMHKALNDGFNEDGVHPIEARDILHQLKLKP